MFYKPADMQGEHHTWCDCSLSTWPSSSTTCVSGSITVKVTLAVWREKEQKVSTMCLSKAVMQYIVIDRFSGKCVELTTCHLCAFDDDLFVAVGMAVLGDEPLQLCTFWWST